MTGQYVSLARFYDKLNAHVDYDKWAAFLDRAIKKYGVKKDGIILDLGCGTGNITLPLSKLGYSMIGADISPDMLNIARDKAYDTGCSDILWLCQDMRSFELYGTVDAVVSCLDCVNYLTGKEGLAKCFKLVRNYLNPGGVFVFDVNTPHKFKNVFGQNDIILESDGVYCGWRNYYDAKSGLCDFELSVFEADKNGRYIRYDEHQRERCYSMLSLKNAVESAGMKLEGVFGGFDFSPASDTDERWFFVANANKNE